MTSEDEPMPPQGHLGDLVEMYRWFAETFLRELEALRVVQDELRDALWPFTNAVTASIDLDDATAVARSRIANQALNDFLDLLYEAICGRGRPALRSARSLFEHLVNERTIARDLEQARRYRDFGAIGDLLDLQLNTQTEEQFTGDLRRRFRHWRHKLERRVVPAADTAIRMYGASFHTRWSTQSLRDRARSRGLSNEYEYYRLLSSVIHGAAGGDVGHRTEINGASVVRTGPALAACPLALRTGTRYFAMLVDDLTAVVGQQATQSVRERIALVEEALPRYEVICRGVDASIWPSEPPRSVMYLRVDVGGAWTWLLRDTGLERVVEAAPIDLDSEFQTRITELVRDIESANPGRTRPVFIGVAGVQGEPTPGVPWRPSGGSLRQGDAQAHYTTVQVKFPLHDPSLYA